MNRKLNDGDFLEQQLRRKKVIPFVADRLLKRITLLSHKSKYFHEKNIKLIRKVRRLIFTFYNYIYYVKSEALNFNIIIKLKLFTLFLQKL